MTKNILFRKKNKAQAMLEYLLLLSAVAAVVFAGYKTFIPKVRTTSNKFFSTGASGIMGDEVAHGKRAADIKEFIKRRNNKGYCGDGHCNRKIGEDCVLCLTDCRGTCAEDENTPDGSGCSSQCAPDCDNGTCDAMECARCDGGGDCVDEDANINNCAEIEDSLGNNIALDDIVCSDYDPSQEGDCLETDENGSCIRPGGIGACTAAIARQCISCNQSSGSGAASTCSRCLTGIDPDFFGACQTNPSSSECSDVCGGCQDCDGCSWCPKCVACANCCLVPDTCDLTYCDCD